MEVKPRIVVLVIIVFGLLLAGIYRFGAAERAQQGPSQLRVDQQGRLHVVFNEKIFRLAPGGEYEKTIGLRSLGIGELIGGIAFFRNGDVLLRTGDSVPNWYEQVLIQLRLRQPRHSTGTPGERLERCNLDSLRCQPLQGFEQTFKRTFRIDIDSRDQVFIADTGREALYWLDGEGHKIAEADAGLRLPNQLMTDGERVVVANTNYHELTFVPLSEGTIAPMAQWRHLKVNVPEAKQSGEIWPVDLLKADGDWLVLSQGPDMMFGDVFRFGEDGQYLTQFRLADEVDPVALAMIGKDVVVADYAGLRLLRFSTRGEPRGELMIPEIARYADEVRTARTHYQRLQWFLWAVFAGALVLGFTVAISGELRIQREKDIAHDAARATAATSSESQLPSPDDPGIHWVSLSKGFRRQSRILLIVVMVMPIIGLLLIPLYDKLTQKPDSGYILAGLYALLIASTAIIAFMIRKVMRSLRVGVIREWVLLRGLSSKFAVGRGSDIGLSSNAIVIDNVSVPIGARKLPTFAPEEWAEWVEPRLTHARKLSAFDMIRWSWKHQRTINLVAIAALVVMVVWRWPH